MCVRVCRTCVPEYVAPYSKIHVCEHVFVFVRSQSLQRTVRLHCCMKGSGCIIEGFGVDSQVFRQCVSAQRVSRLNVKWKK